MFLMSNKTLLALIYEREFHSTSSRNLFIKLSLINSYYVMISRIIIGFFILFLSLFELIDFSTFWKHDHHDRTPSGHLMNRESVSIKNKF